MLFYIPIYPLLVGLILVRIGNTLRSIISRFIWGGIENHRKLHLVSRDRMTKPFRMGGLGVPDLGEMNAAFLVK